VVLSSHILGEVQQICDAVTIISLGRRVAAGPVSEVLAQFSQGGVIVRFETPEELPKAASVLATAGVEVQAQPDHLMLPRVTRPAWISRTLAEAGIYVAQLTPVTVDLETVFLQLTHTAPVEGQHRQVDQSVKVEPTAGVTP